jgi:hypothetical protein
MSSLADVVAKDAHLMLKLTDFISTVFRASQDCPSALSRSDSYVQLSSGW